MRRSLLYGSFTLLFLPWNRIAGAEDINLPAGTLLRCSLDEPNFSSNTAEEGDPVLCRATIQPQFGRGSYPRSAYLVGRLGSYKDPGHFFGKGFLRLEFDRISLPNADLPVSAKVIAVRGYRVDRQGKIIGHGHAKRDAVEWMLPPLWPWKVLALPARGPRPVLKGEVPVTIRLMNAVMIPDIGDSSSNSLGRRLGSLQPQALPKARNASAAEMRLNTMGDERQISGDNTLPLPLADSDSSTSQQSLQLMLFALRNGTTRGVTDCWLEDGRLHYVLPDGTETSAAFGEIDWAQTNRLNFERGMRIVLRSGRQRY
jgi:hypothetical protein